MIKVFRLLILSLLVIHSALSAQERFFTSATVAIRLIDPDSVTVQVNADAQDLMNTVYVFPYHNADKATFRLYEKKLEAYLKERIPVQADGKLLNLKVIQWKPDGMGRKDGFDSAAIYTKEHFITLGGKLPKRRNYLSVRADLWVERTDADKTIVEISLFQNGLLLKRQWSGTEKTLKFPIASDSLAAMRKSAMPGAK